MCDIQESPSGRFLLLYRVRTAYPIYLFNSSGPLIPEFSFLSTSCLTKAKVLSFPSYLLIAGRVTEIDSFPKCHSAKGNINSFVQVGNSRTDSISYDDNSHTKPHRQVCENDNAFQNLFQPYPKYKSKS